MFKNIFNPDNGLMITFAQISDCIFLSLLWVLCCFPVISTGASCAALYDSTFRAFRQGEKNSWGRFSRKTFASGVFEKSFANFRKMGVLIPIIFSFGTVGISLLWKSLYFSSCIEKSFVCSSFTLSPPLSQL
jgi:hypothetical protein